MKSIILFFMIISSTSYAQFSLESSFNSVYIGRNQNLLLNYQWKRFSVNAGLKYNFNKRSDFPQSQGEFYHKTFWAVNFGEHWGTELGFRCIILQKENIDLFGFYQLQITRSHTRHEFYYAQYPLVPEPQSEYDFAYVRHLNYIGPMWAFENNFGLGVHLSFSKSIYFTTKLGGGIGFFKNLDKNAFIFGESPWNFTGMVSMGMGWKFTSKSD